MNTASGLVDRRGHGRARWRRRVHLAVLLAVCVLGVGCTSTVAGTPSAPSSPAPPPRPREVRLNGVDPCSLLTPDQRTALGLESHSSSSKPYVPLFRGNVPTCTIGGNRSDSDILGIGIVTTVGAERWHDRNLAVILRPTTVADYPAFVIVPTQSGKYCGVEIDVAEGQLLDVQELSGGGTPPTPQNVLCERAQRAADEMMKTLLTR